MKAVVFDRHGGPDVLHYTCVADPRPGPGEVVIQVGASTVNPDPDVTTREGLLALPGMALPHIGGTDAAGEVVAVGADVTSHHVGDRVVVYPVLPCGACDSCSAGVGEHACATARLWGAQTWGGRAEFARVPAANLVALPESIGYAAAATLPVAYLTAWHGLVDRARIDEGDTLLVLGASGGVGVAAMQIARHFGAKVIAGTGQEWKRVRALALGADHAVDYVGGDLAEQVADLTDGRGATVVFDNVGERTWPSSLAYLAKGGRFVCSGAATGPRLTVDARWAYRNKVSMHFSTLGTKRNLQELVALVAEGCFDPVIDSRYALHDVVAAELKSAARDHFGKIVLDPTLRPFGGPW